MVKVNVFPSTLRPGLWNVNILRDDKVVWGSVGHVRPVAEAEGAAKGRKIAAEQGNDTLCVVEVQE